MAQLLIPNDLKGVTFGVQNSFTDTTVAGSWTTLQAWDIKFDPSREMIPFPVQKPQMNRGPEPNVAGAYGGKLTFKTYLRGGNGSESEFSKIMRYGPMTRTALPAASAKITAADASTITALDADIGTYTVGQPVMVTGSSTDTQIRWITDVEINTTSAVLTVTPNFSDTPAIGDSLAAIDVLIPRTGEVAGYLSFKVYSGDAGSNVQCWTLTSCVPNFKLSTTDAKKAPIIEWEILCDAWSTAATAGTVVADTYSDVHPILGDSMYVAGSACKVKHIGFDPGLQIQEYVATSGTNGRAGWLALGTQKPKVDILPYFDADWISRWGSTAIELMFSSIKDTNEAWSLWVYKAQVIEHSQEDLGNKMMASKPTFEVCDAGTGLDGDNPSETTKYQPMWAIAVTGSGT